MKAKKSMLMYLLVTLLTCSVVFVPVMADGPWDVDTGGGSETNGGGNRGDRSLFADSQSPTIDDADYVGPSLVTLSISYLLYQAGFTNQAFQFIEEPINKRQKSSRNSRPDNTKR